MKCCYGRPPEKCATIPCAHCQRLGIAVQERQEAAAAVAEQRAAESKQHVQYKAVLHIQEAAGGAGSASGSRAALHLSLFGSRGETGVQRLDGSHAAPGKPLVCLFEGPNIGQLERLRIGLAADVTTTAGSGSNGASGGQQQGDEHDECE